VSFVNEFSLGLIKRYTPCRVHIGFNQYVPYKPQKQEGLWYIGYGSIRLGRHGLVPNQKVTYEEIHKQLLIDLEHFSSLVEPMVHMPLNAKKQGAVLSYAHSIGITHFKDCHLLELINARASRTEIIKEWSPFLRQNYQSNLKLVDRRRSELDLYLQSDKNVPLLVEHKCKLPQCLLNVAENFNGSLQQVKAIEYLEDQLMKFDPKGKVIDKFFQMWNQRPLTTGSKTAYPEVDLKTQEALRYASSLIPEESEVPSQMNSFFD